MGRQCQHMKSTCCCGGWAGRHTAHAHGRMGRQEYCCGPPHPCHACVCVQRLCLLGALLAHVHRLEKGDSSGSAITWRWWVGGWAPAGEWCHPQRVPWQYWWVGHGVWVEQACRPHAANCHAAHSPSKQAARERSASPCHRTAAPLPSPPPCRQSRLAPGGKRGRSCLKRGGAARGKRCRRRLQFTTGNYCNSTLTKEFVCSWRGRGWRPRPAG